MSKARYKAKFTFDLEGEDLEVRGAVAAFMARLQMLLEHEGYPIKDWRLDSLEKQK